MTYKTNILIEKEVLDRLNGLLDIDDLSEIPESEKQLNPKVDDFIPFISAEFGNGNVIDIDVCSGSTNYYDNCVLKDRGGNELYCFECGFGIDKVNEFYCGTDTYVVVIETY